MALRKLLGRSLLDSVIDSAGGMIAQQAGQVLRQGGRIVIYGMTVAPQAPFTMREELWNQRLIGQNKLAFPLIDIFDSSSLFQARRWAQRRTSKQQRISSCSTGLCRSSRVCSMDLRIARKDLSFSLAESTLARSSLGWMEALQVLNSDCSRYSDGTEGYRL